MVKIGEDREIPAMPLERIQRRRQSVIRARRGWEKALLINTVIVRQTNRFTGPALLAAFCAARSVGIDSSSGDAMATPTPFKKCRLSTFIKATLSLAKRTKSKK